LKDSLSAPELVFTDFAKMESPSQIHLGMRALHLFAEQQNGKLPAPWSQKDADVLIKYATFSSKHIFLLIKFQFGKADQRNFSVKGGKSQRRFDKNLSIHCTREHCAFDFIHWWSSCTGMPESTFWQVHSSETMGTSYFCSNLDANTKGRCTWMQ
jgi:hypothetical protein